jgi:hypothetical protein
MPTTQNNSQAPAFPTGASTGCTKPEKAAFHALQGLLANSDGANRAWKSVSELSLLAVESAVATLKALEKAKVDD